MPPAHGGQHHACPRRPAAFAVSHFPTSSANRTAYTALPSATQGTSCKTAGPMPSAYAQNGESTATATPEEPAAERSHRQHQIDAGAGHELTEALRGDLQHEQQRRHTAVRTIHVVFFIEVLPISGSRASAASRATAGAAARLPLPEQVYDRKRDERREHETNEVVARFIAAGPFSNILLPV